MISHSKTRPVPFRPLTALLLAASVAGAVACSGQDDTALNFESASTAPIALPSAEEREAEFQRQVATPLSADERIAVEAALSESGMDVSELGFAGRLATFGDAYLDVEALLNQSQDREDTVQKGRTLAVTDNTVSVGGQVLSPLVISKDLNGSYFFHRPDIIGVKIVVPNAASFLVNAFQQAANAVVAAANDCLSQIFVMTQSQYDGLPQDDKILSKPIFITYDVLDTACPAHDPNDTTTAACAIYPREERREFDINLTAQRLVPGPRIGVNNAKVTSSNLHVPDLTHELLHAFGLAHTNQALGIAIVPGSSCKTTTSSIMHTNGISGAGASTTITADDKATIDVLYSPAPGGSCAYSRGLKAIAPSVDTQHCQ